MPVLKGNGPNFTIISGENLAGELLQKIKDEKSPFETGKKGKKEERK